MSKDNDVCCMGQCQVGQGDSCPRYRSNPPTEREWKRYDLLVYAIASVSAAVLFSGLLDGMAR